MINPAEICSRARWDHLCASLNLTPDPEIYNALIAAHAEAHRAYHTLDHIAACLRHLDDVKDLANRPQEIEMALWFHDAVYEPFSTTNEEDSAAWAAAWLRGHGAEAAVIDRVRDYIIATKSHDAPATQDGQLMLDIDLSILASPSEIFNIYETNIRREYRRVPKFIFRKKRKSILNEFLTRKQIYAHPYFHARWDGRARENLRRAISAL